MKTLDDSESSTPEKENPHGDGEAKEGNEKKPDEDGNPTDGNIGSKRKHNETEVASSRESVQPSKDTAGKEDGGSVEEDEDAEAEASVDEGTEERVRKKSKTTATDED